ncbi:MAG: preprotein translocase subunit YajC [Hydrogenophilales bacterium CG17_big_fil_post_rev_8_21_14_2_50_63_12]|nr:MAG: preprotein translocase subunit YajC [Hydrogenophilales bacterium CG17_big_fil_post_rev_8_21_14_2_50_63_12]PIX96108.1 MAG: preprotein translocase subunit YajC [Hydrogenophilales bacterium CG_4_10_14_3_um_filter_63_21]PJB04630.1 MAG: preprotein translocase subunit YajC [Hydrogenophilales bacterium CG_4_9_14_3_um_filter_63_34]
MLISPAYAAPAAGQPDPIMTFLPLVVLFALFYFMIIRPQMKRTKDQKKMQEGIQKGDEVVTAGGQVGKVVKISEQYITLDIGGGTESHFQRGTVQTVLPKGTIKDL